MLASTTSPAASPQRPVTAIRDVLKPLETYGATFQNVGSTGVQVRFPDPKHVEVANSVFEQTIRGIPVTYSDANGRGVRGIAGSDDVVAALEELPGVARSAHGSGVLVVVANHQAFSGIDELLRPMSATGDEVHVRDKAVTDKIRPRR